MNIDSMNCNYNVPMQGKNLNWFKRQIKRAGQWFLDMSPSHTTKDTPNSPDKWNKINNICSNPMWNRGIMGATALATQPWIDYYNHRVDDETRTVSRNRTIAKICAGTLVGMFVVRGPIYKIVEKLTDINGTKSYSKALLPKNFLSELRQHDNYVKNYRSAIAMALALIAMSVTNFILDAPLTTFFTNYLNKKSGIKANDDYIPAPKPAYKKEREVYNA